MLTVNLKTTYGYKALAFEAYLSSRLIDVTRIGTIFLAIVTAFLFLFSRVGIAIPPALGDRALGLFFMAFSIGFASSLWLIFIEYIKHYPAPFPLKRALEDPQARYNLADWFGSRILGILVRISYEGTSRAAFLKALISTNEAKNVFNRLGIQHTDLEKKLEMIGDTDEKEKSLGEVLLEAGRITGNWGHEKIEVGECLSALAKRVRPFEEFLFERELEVSDVENVAIWQERVRDREERLKKFWTWENLARIPGLAKDWATSYTFTLERFSRDLIEKAAEGAWQGLELIGHREEIEQMERVLASSGEKNVLLIGEPGSGRRTVIVGLANLIASGRVVPELEHKRLVELDLNALLAGAETVPAMQERLITVCNEAVRAKNVILVINEFDNFIGKAFAPGKIDISGILGQYFDSKYFQVVGVSDYSGFHRYLEPNALIMRSFERVEIKEPNLNETILILEEAAPFLEKRAGVVLSYATIREVAKKASTYLEEPAMPERAIQLLDEVTVFSAHQGKGGIVEPAAIDAVITQKTGVPIGKMAEKEKDVLINLEDRLHTRLVDQEEAIATIASSMRRARTGITSMKRPIGSFLFLGPTGVGKTETAKALASVYFGAEGRMLRFDMSEYQQQDDLKRLIGSFERGEPGKLANALREQPFSLVLFDEFEKAHPDILNLFLQIFDEGGFTDAFGKKVNATHAIIIATSNAGANLIREYIEAGVDPANMKEKIIDWTQSNGIFKTELLNRFDAIVIYRPLAKTQLLEIARLMLEDLAKRLEEKDLTLVMTPQLQEWVVEHGYKQEFGARPMRRVIQDVIEDRIAKKILTGELKRGAKIELTPEELR